MKDKEKNFYIGTLNVQGGNNDAKKQSLADDMKKYKLKLLCTTETRIPGEVNVETLTTTCKEQNYKHYTSGGTNKKTRYGVGILACTDLSVEFKAVSERMCMATIESTGNEPNLIIISAYAPTEPQSTKNPKLREQFYSDLDALVNSVNKRDVLYIGGDFNAKTGSAYSIYPENMGIHGKGEANSNGMRLLDFCATHNMHLTNTKFHHKLAHRTTWQSAPRQDANHKDGTPRRNPYRNMIDYVLVRNEYLSIVKDSRSYSNIETTTDHRLVRAEIKISKPLRPAQKKREDVVQYDLNKMKDPEVAKAYQAKVESKLEEELENCGSPQEKWDTIVTACHDSAAEVAPKQKNAKKSSNPAIIKLAAKQKELNKKINANMTHKKRQETCKERNKVKSDLRKLIAEEKNEYLMERVADIEKFKDDAGKMFQAVRTAVSMKDKKELLIDTGRGVTSDESLQTNLITDFFKEYFTSDEVEEVGLDIQPTAMSKPFTKEEISKSIQKLKNNKAAGIDKLKSEMLKYGPDCVAEVIAELLNTAAESGTYPLEINTGILTPLQKPGKKRGPCSNLSPIILLSILRKILAISLMDRVADRILQHVPHSQSAYQKDRSTTEQIFAFKILAEKAMTSEDYHAHILLMDMSKAFDTVNRKTLLDDLKRILNPDELHLVKILIDKVKLAVRVGKTTGNLFETNIGVPPSLTYPLHPIPRQSTRVCASTSRSSVHETIAPRRQYTIRSPRARLRHHQRANSSIPTRITVHPCTVC